MGPFWQDCGGASAGRIHCRYVPAQRAGRVAFGTFPSSSSLGKVKAPARQSANRVIFPLPSAGGRVVLVVRHSAPSHTATNRFSVPFKLAWSGKSFRSQLRLPLHCTTSEQPGVFRMIVPPRSAHAAGMSSSGTECPYRHTPQYRCNW
jgi:hypothetical protein